MILLVNPDKDTHAVMLHRREAVFRDLACYPATSFDRTVFRKSVPRTEYNLHAHILDASFSFVSPL